MHIRMLCTVINYQKSHKYDILILIIKVININNMDNKDGKFET